MSKGNGGIFERIGRIVVLILSTAGLLVGINYIFHLNLLPVPIDLSYLYSIMAIYGSLGFLFYRAKKETGRPGIPWYDWSMFLVVLGCGMYLSWSGYDAVTQGWSMAPPKQAVVISILLWIIMLEGGRRAGGIWLTLLAAFFSVYPLLAPYLPGMLWGPPAFSIDGLAAYHFISNASVLGLPMRVIGQLVFGYIVFGATLQYTGGGQFFLDFALSLFGHVRGGVAKVALISSALMGSMSGAVASNVIVTGSVTIPAMKKSGYPSHLAGAVEACVSTGGALLPPVMGAVAFVMAMVLAIPYYEVCLAAAIPSVLYYLSLFIQIDAYAARNGLRGFDRSELPQLGPVMKEGWPYLFSVVLLSVFLFIFRQEAQAPFYASAFLILFAMAKKKTRLSLKRFGEYIVTTGKFISELTLILAVIGFIIGSFYVTGLGGTMSYEITRMAGGNLALLLIFGAATSFILGMGMTATACYIFLAITVAPALVKGGVHPMAAHLFILYWGLLSYITPPVAVAAYAAAPIAGAPPMKIGFTAMRLGIILYMLPFLFTISPSLILQGPVLKILINFVTAVVGIMLMGGGIERYILGLGKIPWPVAMLLIVAGVMLVYPFRHISLVGLGIAVIVIALVKIAGPKRLDVQSA